MQTSVTAQHSTLTNHDDRTLRSVFCAYTAMATFWLLFATAVGVLMAYKFGAPDFWPGAWLTFGDAFSTDDPFDPRRAEARSSIPVWVWVMSLFVVAWAVWYAARMWDVLAEYAQTPTYATQSGATSQ
jgi:hypothetical protein